MKRSPHYWRNLGLFTLCAVTLAMLWVTVWLGYTRAVMLVRPARYVAERAPSDVGLAYWEDVTFYAPDGVRLHGWFIPPQPNNLAGIIFVLGWATNRAHLLEEAALLARHGYGALLFDLRNHGASGGTITTLGYLEAEDVRSAVAYVLTRAEVDARRIVLMGHSMGAGTVLRAGARIEHARAVIAMSAYASLEDNIVEGVEGLTGLPAFPFAPLVIWFGEREAGLNIRHVRPIDDIAHISPRAVMLIHGELDTLIPVRNAHRLYHAAREPKELYIIRKAGHVALMQAEPREYERRVSEFLRRALE
ncbi:MAG: alpha/beta hydrolase [Anaerolineae bacterium]|nr:alpha/beta hydrolase [Anaerolineae bacterium]